jgi:hypothetical protein
MRRREFISCVIATCFAVIIPADRTHTQTTKQAATESALAAKIKCKDFQKTSEGKWIPKMRSQLTKAPTRLKLALGGGFLLHLLTAAFGPKRTLPPC